MSGHNLYRINYMKLISTLLATTAIANAAVVFDTRIDFDFNTGPGQPPNVAYDNVGKPLSFDFFEFGPQTFYMNVYNEVERSQIVTSIDFSVDSRIAVKSAEFYTGEALDGKGGDGGVDSTYGQAGLGGGGGAGGWYSSTWGTPGGGGVGIYGEGTSGGQTSGTTGEGGRGGSGGQNGHPGEPQTNGSISSGDIVGGN